MNNDLTADKKRMLVALFNDRENAEQAYNDLKNSGYSADEINVVMKNDTRDKYFGDTDEAGETEMGNKALEGTGTGAAIGGVLGGIGGAIAAIGTNLLIPGLGLVILGPLAAGLAGAGAGGVTGGIIGALIGAGIPKDKANLYNEGLENGKILISVHPHSENDVIKFRDTWTNYNAEHIYS